ncbi:hypothetical protein DNC80_14385 [Flavobacterium sp. SOK18b]|uniref:hypothetical protein n=1 Tax=Flavobacterium sp. SOK18b TaxID=797900 RepID=UPI0015FE786E|nr:hypothetical protein [Flavobacterium sp. SOK18b]MBB1194855.1 hypothetical protein [Flavobacterium sp. SOK18b]
MKEKYKEFIRISEKENYEEIFKSLKKPIVFSANPRYFSRYQPLKEMLIKFLNYHSSILVNKDIGYDLCQNEINDSAYYENIMKVQYLWSRHYISISRSNSKRFLVSQFINKVEFDEHYLIDTLMINYNHFFLQFIIKHHVAIQNDASFKKIVKSCFEFIYDIYESDKKSIGAVKELNDILKPLNHISKLKKFTLSDL